MPNKWDNTSRLRLVKTTITSQLFLILPFPLNKFAMNYTAGQIGKWQEVYRTKCITIGEETGLYKDDVVPRGCTPSYLPKFIPIEVAKLKK